MAKQSSIQKNINREKIVNRFKSQRNSLKKNDYEKRFKYGRKI